MAFLYAPTLVMCSLLFASQVAQILSAPNTNSQITRQTTASETTQPIVDTMRPVVQTTSGLLEGTKQELKTNMSIYKFLSVAYARAPVGELRFKRPVELAAEQAHERVNATQHGKTCVQFRHLKRFISPLLRLDEQHEVSEDCLHLNVYVPATINNQSNRQHPLPVTVWLPGEGFDYADARQFDATYLALETQSIVVTVQYRVGVFGFLHAPELGARGNMGIYDQIMALRWVQRNINAFGGDPERVTLMGRFSGSMSISSMLIAPKANELLRLDNKPLFRRAVLLSGVVVDDWIVEREQVERVKRLRALALELGYCSESQVDQRTCLQTLDAEKLLEISGYAWKLVPDNELIGGGGIIEALERGHLFEDVQAVLFGETGAEGTLCLYRHALSGERNNYAQLIDEDRLTSKIFNEMIEDDSLTYFNYNTSQSNPMQMALEAIVEENYSMLKNENANLRDKYLAACSSYLVRAHANRFKRNVQLRNERVEKREKPIEVYHYELKYKPTFSLAPDYVKTAAHGDDIPLIFGLIYQQPREVVDSGDLLMTRKMMTYIGNFVHGEHPLDALLGVDQPDQNEQDCRGHAQATTSAIKRNWLSGDKVHSLNLAEAPDQQQQRTSGDLSQPHQSSTTTLLSNHELLLHRVNVKQQDLESDRVDSGLELIQRGKVAKLVAYADNNGNKAHRANLGMIQQLDRPQLLIELKADLGSRTKQHERSISRSQKPIELRQLERRLLDSSNNNNGPVAQRQQSQLLLTVPQIDADIIKQQVAADSASQALTNDSYLMSALLISACVVILALTSFCIVLSLIIFRYNMVASRSVGFRHQDKHQQRKFNSSSSTCNICDDSQGDSIDAVLHVTRANQAPANKHGFCGVFSKLRHDANQHHSSATNTMPITNCGGAQNALTVHELNDRRTLADARQAAAHHQTNDLKAAD